MLNLSLSDEGDTDYSQLTVKPNSPGITQSPLPRPPIPSRSQQRFLAQQRIGRADLVLPLPSPSLPGASQANSIPGSVSTQPTPGQSSHERSRSNSESTMSNARATKRMGTVYVHQKKHKLGTVDEIKSAKHHHVRGYSHDSIIETQHRHETTSEQIPVSRSPTDPDKPTAGRYFRRLSSLPEQKRSSMSTARVAEGARGILYSLSQSHSAISIFLTNSGERSKHAPLERVLFNANNQIGNLVRALETYDSKGDETAVDPVLTACSSCVGAFRHAMSLLQSTLREISSESDIRLTRTLLLMIYGVFVELQNSWASLRPILPIPPASLQSQSNSYFPRQATSQGSNLRLKSGPAGSLSLPISTSTSQGIPPPLPTPKSPDAIFQVPPTPSIASCLYVNEAGIPESDEPLFDNVNAATLAALSTLPQITDAIIKMGMAKSLPPNTMLKMKELDILCGNTRDVARRLKSRLDVIRDHNRDNNVVERRKFWDDTNIFIKVSNPES